MKNLIFFTALLLAGSSLLSSCDDGKEVENEMSMEHPMPTSDQQQLGFVQGEVFGNGLLAIKDTVNVACQSAAKGFPFDTLTFKGMISPPISVGQRAFEMYTSKKADSVNFGEWKRGFFKAGMEKIGISDSSKMEKIIEFYSLMDTDGIINSSNIQNAFEIAKIQGGKQAKLTNEKVL